MQELNWVVQHNEWNKHLGPFKRQVPKLLNLINVKIVPYIMENEFILIISLDMCILLLDADIVDFLQHIYHVRGHPVGCTYIHILSVSGVHTLI